MRRYSCNVTVCSPKYGPFMPTTISTLAILAAPAFGTDRPSQLLASNFEGLGILYNLLACGTEHRCFIDYLHRSSAHEIDVRPANVTLDYYER